MWQRRVATIMKMVHWRQSLFCLHFFLAQHRCSSLRRVNPLVVYHGKVDWLHDKRRKDCERNKLKWFPVLVAAKGLFLVEDSRFVLFLDHPSRKYFVAFSISFYGTAKFFFVTIGTISFRARASNFLCFGIFLLFLYFFFRGLDYIGAESIKSTFRNDSIQN